MNIKQKCTKCGRELVKGRRTQMLMQGPRGYRLYDVCLRCAGKTKPSARTLQKLAREAPLSASTPTSPQMDPQSAGAGDRNFGGEERKAGV